MIRHPPFTTALPALVDTARQYFPSHLGGASEGARLPGAARTSGPDRLDVADARAIGLPPPYGRNAAKTLSELVIHDSRNTVWSGLRSSSAIAPARQNQFSSS